jgi:hypothetical protein
MHKLSQKELLKEGFWDKFNYSNIAKPLRVGKQIMKSVGSVVAPEFVNPILKTKEWFKNLKKDTKRAAMSKTEIAIEHIMEDGFYPLGNEKMRWNPKKNTDNTITGKVKVGELEINPVTGNPELGRTFAPDKSNYIFKFDPETRDIKTIRRPYRHLATDKSEKNW